MMPYKNNLLNRFTESVPEIQSPNFYARPLQARAVQKIPDILFPSTGQVTWLVF